MGLALSQSNTMSKRLLIRFTITMYRLNCYAFVKR